MYLHKIEFQGELLSYTYFDAVILTYKLVKNGVIFHDGLSGLQDVNEYVSTGTKRGTDSFLEGRILDYTRNVIGHVSIEKLPGMPEKIYFNLNPNTYTLLNPVEYYQDGQLLFNIPINGIEMVRVP